MLMTAPDPAGPASPLGVAQVLTDVRRLVAQLDDLALGDALDAFGELRSIVDAAEARRLGHAVAAAERDGHDPVKAAHAATKRGGNRSSRDARLAANRAWAVAANPDLGDQLSSGTMSSGQIDNVAHAMECDSAAATDADLLTTITERSVDQGRRIANDWITDHTSQKKAARKHERERRNRCATRYWSATRDAEALTLYGDGSTIEQLWQAICAQERVEYRNDGGRDVRLKDHPRTRDQRRFDAAAALLLGTAKLPGGRPAVVFNIPWRKISGDDPDSCAEQIGNGPIPDQVVLDALVTAGLFVNVTDIEGQTLWWGRAKRNADINQFLALVVRDKGCVMCGSDFQSCDVHHLMPHNAPGRGGTDLDNLVLVDPGCHHHLHDTKQTLYRAGPADRWAARPATPNEIASPRPKRRRTRERASPRPSPSALDDDH